MRSERSSSTVSESAVTQRFLQGQCCSRSVAGEPRRLPRQIFAWPPGKRVMKLGAELGETRSGEVAVKRECLANPQRAHDGKARRVDERVLAIVAPPEP